MVSPLWLNVVIIILMLIAVPLLFIFLGFGWGWRWIAAKFNNLTCCRLNARDRLKPSFPEPDPEDEDSSETRSFA